MSKFKLTALAALCVTSFASNAEKIAIVGGTVHTMSEQGTVDNATVLIDDGRIQAVGSDITTDGYRVIDANGKVVTPGFIGAYTSLGLVEVSSWANTVDSTVENSHYQASLDVSYAVSPDTTLRNISRIEGITSAATSMAYTDTLFKGLGAMITLGDNETPVTKRRAFMTIDISNSGADKTAGSRASLWMQVRDAFAEAVFAQGMKFSPKSDWYGVNLTPVTDWHGTLSKSDVRALMPVVNGNVPLLIVAHRAADIRQVLALLQDYPRLNITLVGASEAWRVADELAAAGIEVIINPESNLPYAFEQNGATLENAARLHAAGVKVAVGMDTHNIRLAPQQAGNAVANGLPYAAGLAALTTVPAQIYGMDEQIGALKAGMQADVVVWSGDPLEVMEAPTHVIINGVEVPLESRQTKLRDRYLTLDSEKPKQYTRP
ncbi:amidohydrolase family protein [Thalassotalea maritima]|uniref:amidohydrolase family protein n=1 Tax=Thalassotalea maritima TaxID=3242416 RepID=UPI003527B434